MKISFIIPVYEVEAYLDQCLTSVLNVRKRNKEILLILRNKTGSDRDASMEICRMYAEQHEEIRILYQDGSGLSNARNCGMKAATGDYILFLDSDDYILPGKLQKRLCLLEKANKDIDFLASDFIGIRQGTGRKREIYSASSQITESEQILINDDILKQYIKVSGSIWNVWRYIYRRNFLMAHQIFFLENSRCEDVLFTAQVLLNAKCQAFYHEPYYCYRMRRKGALTAEQDIHYVVEFLTVINKTMEIIPAPLFSDCAGLLRKKLQREYILNLPVLFDVPKEERKLTEKLLASGCQVLKEGKRYGVLYAWLKRFGVRIPAVILYLIRSLRRICIQAGG